MEPLFNIQTSDYHNNVYHYYALLRDKHPVYLDPVRNVWMITRYDDVRTLLRNHTECQNNNTSHSYVPNLSASDGDFHKGLRSHVIAQFSQSVARQLEPKLEEIMLELFSELPDHGEIDIYHRVVKRVPQKFMTHFLGFPDEYAQRWFELGDPLMGDDPESDETNDPMTLMHCLDEVQVMVKDVLEYKRQNPGDDFFTWLVNEEAAGELTEREVIVFANNMALAGLDTTINLLGNGVGLLARFPEQRAKLIASPELMSGAIEEMLRMEGPTQALPRRLIQPLTLHGIEIPKGEEISLVFAAANHDPDKYPEPGQFDIERKNHDHLTMGFGLHKCLGQHLARVEAKSFFKHLLKKYPEYELGEHRWLISWWARGYAALTIKA